VLEVGGAGTLDASYPAVEEASEPLRAVLESIDMLVMLNRVVFLDVWETGSFPQLRLGCYLW
jgi:hypothetical protein